MKVAELIKKLSLVSGDNEVRIESTIPNKDYSESIGISYDDNNDVVLYEVEE